MNTTLNHNGEMEAQRVIPPAAEPRVASYENKPARLWQPPRSRGMGAKLVIGIAAALVVVGALLFQRSRSEARLKAATLELAVPTVATIAPKAGPAETEIVLPGNLTAYS